MRPCVRARTPSHARRMPLTVLPPSRAGRAHAPPRPRCWPAPRPALPAAPHGSQKACGCVARRRRHHRRHRGRLSRRRRRAPPLPTRTATRATALRRACAHTARAARANLRGCRGAEVQRSRGSARLDCRQRCNGAQRCRVARQLCCEWRAEHRRACALPRGRAVLAARRSADSRER